MIVVQPFRKRSEQAVSVLSAENPEFVQHPCFARQNPPIFHILDCFNIVFLKAELPCIGMARCKGCKNARTLFGFQIQAVVDRIKTFAEDRFRDLKKLIVTSIFANHARRLQRSRVLGEHLKALGIKPAIFFYRIDAAGNQHFPNLLLFRADVFNFHFQILTLPAAADFELRSIRRAAVCQSDCRLLQLHPIRHHIRSSQ